jgi:2',3'-cyclic-nucleotide 2'-phosphodiesterase (5'-nucleotidase family)
MAMDGSTGQIGRILRKFPQIDAVICGHSHRICRGENVNRSLVVQPGSHGEAAVLLKLHFSDHDRSLQYVTSRILRPGTDEDPGIAGIREMARRQTAKDFSRELGYFDSMERFGGKAVKLLRQISGCEAAVLTLDNGGYSGNFTEEKLFFAMPYRNRFHMVKMSRTDFQKLVLQLKRGKLKYFVDIAANAPEVINAAISDHVLKKIFDPEKMQLRSVTVFDRERLAVELEKSR